MKRIYLIFFVIVLVLFLAGYVLINPIWYYAMSNKPNIPINKERLYLHLKELTSIDPSRNFENISSLNQSANYILNQFKKIKCNVELQRYTVGNNEYKNVICSFGPIDGERIIIGAHYDVCGNQPGADDNASGIAGLLEIARLINEQKPKLKHRVDLVAYSLEEPPFFRTKFMGSAVHAKSLADSAVKVKVMMSLEMIGFFSEEPGSQDYPVFFLKWFYPNKANFITVVGNLKQRKIVKQIKKYMIQGSNIDVYSINAPAFLPGIDFSDHVNYWKHKYNATMITDTAFYRNPNYHKKTDSIETIDFDKMAEVIKGIYWAIISL